MQPYAKHLIALVTIFFLSVLYFQPSIIEADPLVNPKEETTETTQGPQESVPIKPQSFTMVCVGGKTLYHGLDTQMRNYHAQISRNFFYAPRPGARPLQHRCYFKFPSEDIACYNPRFVDQQFLDTNNLVASPSFSGGKPGQQCYFKKDAIGKYSDIIRILQGSGNQPALLRATVKHPHQAVMRIKND